MSSYYPKETSDWLSYYSSRYKNKAFVSKVVNCGLQPVSVKPSSATNFLRRLSLTSASSFGNLLNFGRFGHQLIFFCELFLLCLSFIWRKDRKMKSKEQFFVTMPKICPFPVILPAAALLKDLGLMRESTCLEISPPFRTFTALSSTPKMMTKILWIA